MVRPTKLEVRIKSTPEELEDAAVFAREDLRQNKEFYARLAQH